MSFLTFQGITKVFLPLNDGVFDIDFVIDQNEFVFLTGPSGAGKTTLLKLLCGQYTPNQGSIELDGQVVNQLRGKQLELFRRQLGIVYQDYQLISEFNVWENIAAPLFIAGKNDAEIERRVTDLLDLVGLHDKALLFPKQLSGGEAQRVSIARALALNPKLIFADEPTGNLDYTTAKNIVNLLKKINSLGTCVLVATHDQKIIDLYPNCKIIVIEAGKITRGASTKVETLPPDEPSPEKSSAHKIELKSSEKTKSKPVKKDKKS
ncbi:MAG TPA: ATP-binding cassette domain-containing protein [Candidatus Woesebacteria bacterium]|nr:ATP-binding cassette domain-containing protein [Candidatus Woesebacteria bacterium]